MQVHEFNSDVFGMIGEGQVMAPTIPVSAKSLCEVLQGSSIRENRTVQHSVVPLPDNYTLFDIIINTPRQQNFPLPHVFLEDFW